MGNESNPHRDVRLPAHLYESAERIIAGTRFKTVDEFLSFVVQELSSANSAQFDEREKKAIEDRLRDLGYL